MTEVQFINVDDDDFIDAPKALRDHVKKLQKGLTDVTKERDKLRTKELRRTAVDVLAELDRPAGLARFLQADGIDPSNKESVAEWLKENAEVFGPVSSNPTDATQEQQPAQDADQQAPPQQQTVTPDAQQALQQMADATAGAQPAGADAFSRATAEVASHPEWTAQQVRECFVAAGL